MKRPAKAFLLAAGLGMRMRPLTDNLPKAMLPLWGKPLLGHVMELVRSWGVREILVNAHHAPAPLVQYLRNRPKDGLTVTISFEAQLLGTGGALKHAAWFPDSEPFWIINTDIAVDVSPQPLLADFEKHPGLATVWLDATTGPRTVDMVRHQVTSFRSRTPRSPGTYTFCGLQLVSPALLDYFPEDSAFSLVDVYERAMRAGEKIRGVTVPDSYWSDLGTPSAYREAHGEVFRRYKAGLPGGRLHDHSRVQSVASLRRGGACVTGYACISKKAIIGKGAEIDRSVVWDNARVEPRCRLTNSIVAGGAVVSARVDGVAAPCLPETGRAPAFEDVLRVIGWKARATTLISLGARGSDRSFARLSMKGRNAIMIQYGSARPENGRYASHARFLRSKGVPVPRLLADIPAKRTTVMEYLGGPSLEELARSTPEAVLEAKYRSVLDALLVMHGISRQSIAAGRVRLEPQFSAGLFAWERDLMARYFLRGHLKLDEKVVLDVVKELESMSGRLTAAPKVLLHRDFQSSNIIWQHGGPVFIDFQGMRLGPAVYDLASLLCDPYVQLSSGIQARLLEYYARRTSRPEQTVDLFWYAAVQRLAQALGAFGRLSALPETAGFAWRIRPGLIMMNRALSRLVGLERTRQLVGQLLIRVQPDGTWHRSGQSN